MADLRSAQTALFRAAALGCLLANCGRSKLGKEIRENIQRDAPVEYEHEAQDNWLGYRPNAFTALHGFNQGYFYYFGMAIFYWHLAKRRGQLSKVELAGLFNQILFHAHSIYDFRGLSQKVSAAFMVVIGAGALCQHLAQ